MSEEKKSLVVVDEDREYIRGLEPDLVRRFDSVASIHVITSREYLEEYFSTPRSIDVLVIDATLFKEEMKQHDIGHVLKLVTEIALDPISGLEDLLGEHLEVPGDVPERIDPDKEQISETKDPKDGISQEDETVQNTETSDHEMSDDEASGHETFVTETSEEVLTEEASEHAAGSEASEEEAESSEDTMSVEKAEESKEESEEESEEKSKAPEEKPAEKVIDMITLMKFLSQDEILACISGMLIKKEPEPEPQKDNYSKDKPETKVVVVYSPLGGCGKSLMSWGLARKLKKLDISVLLVGCDSLQSFGAFLETEDYADPELADALKWNDEGTYWKILQNVGQQKISYLKPFREPLGIVGFRGNELECLIRHLKERRDFSYVILDLSNELSGRTLTALKMADAMVMIMEADEISNRKMMKLISNLELIPRIQCFMVANQHHTDGLRIARQNLFGTLPNYEDCDQAMEDPLFYRIALELEASNP